MIYFDNASTTAVSPSAADVVLEMMCENFANPSSLHSFGLAAENRSRKATSQIAELLGCRSEELVFTSGGTESVNLAVLGALNASRRERGGFVICASSHSCALRCAEEAQLRGFNVSLVKPLPDSSANIEGILDLVGEKTALVSLMLVNNETGAISDVKALSEKVKKKNPKTLIHADCVAAFGKINFSPSSLGADLVSVSAHKLHGPAGVGALYVKKGTRLLPVMFGGGAQKSLRPGTENTPGICGFGAAAEEISKKLEQNLKNVKALNRFLREFLSSLPDAAVNSPENASPFVLNFSTNRVKSETMLHFLSGKNIFVSAGSACSGSKRSHVLESMNLPQKAADTALRLSFCGSNTVDQGKQFAEALKQGFCSLVQAY